MRLFALFSIYNNTCNNFKSKAGYKLRGDARCQKKLPIKVKSKLSIINGGIKNRKHKRYLSKRSTARSFLRVATKEDIQALIEFANEQLKERF